MDVVERKRSETRGRSVSSTDLFQKFHTNKAQEERNEKETTKETRRIYFFLVLTHWSKVGPQMTAMMM